MKRTALKRKTKLRSRPRPTDPLIVAELVKRSQGRCEAAIVFGCTGRGTDPHHKLMRSHGGKDSLDNMIWTCRLCHDWIHRNPAESYRDGWLIRGVT